MRIESYFNAPHRNRAKVSVDKVVEVSEESDINEEVSEQVSEE
jgi:hypothetical protein